MRKITSLFLVIVIVMAFAAIPASAANYSRGGFTINIPDDLIEDKAIALEFDMTNSWITEDGNFELHISIEENDENYTYVNYTEKEIQNIYDDYVKGEEEYYTLDKGENITVSGFEGVRLDMSIDYLGAKAKNTVCAFSTKQEVYTLFFYIYEDSYVGYVDELINSVVIDGKDYDAEKEGNTQYLIYLAVVFAASAISSFFKKAKAKKKAAAVMAQTVHDSEAVNNSATTDTDMNISAETLQNIPDYQIPPASANGFAAKEAERERKEREKMFD